MADININLQQCSVILKPCTPKMRKCFVSLEHDSRSRSRTPDIKKKVSHPQDCFVSLELCTPKTDNALTTQIKQAIKEKNILTTKTKTKFISALDELEALNKENSRKSRKSQAIQEILDSEIAYIKQLEVIINFFKKPLVEQDILTHDDTERLFGTISTIYNVNEELLSMLKENPLHIGKAFNKIAPFFKLYSAFAYDYKTILDVLLKNEINNVEFGRFLHNQESRPEVQAKLSALLIAPIQRIPRYCLLIRQVLVNTSPMEDEYEILKESLKKVEESARHTDTLVHERENSEHLLNIQNSLQNNIPVIIRPGRKLIKEGYVVKIDGAHNSQSYLVAMTDIIMLCKVKKDNLHARNSLKCTCILPLNKCRIRQNPTSRNIEVRCLKEVLMLYIDKQSDFEEWIKVLKASVTDYIFNRQTLRKESSSRKPAFKKDVQDYSDVGLSPGQRQRKRRIEDTDLELNVENIKSKRCAGENRKFYSRRILKRKSIRESSATAEADADRNHKTNDSLFPLRYHFLPSEQKHEEKIENENVKSQKEDRSTTEDVFVFGKASNRNRGFNFKIINFFTCLSNSFKRVFGFK